MLRGAKMDNMLLKSKLTPQQMLLLQSEYENRKKSKSTAYLFWFFLGCLGGHRFYAGDTTRGILMLITLGFFGIWTLIDVFFIGARIDQKNKELENKLIQKVLSITPTAEQPTI